MWLSTSSALPPTARRTRWTPFPGPPIVVLSTFHEPTRPSRNAFAIAGTFGGAGGGPAGASPARASEAPTVATSATPSDRTQRVRFDMACPPPAGVYDRRAPAHDAAWPVRAEAVS